MIPVQAGLARYQLEPFLTHTPQTSLKVTVLRRSLFPQTRIGTVLLPLTSACRSIMDVPPLIPSTTTMQGL